MASPIAHLPARFSAAASSERWTVATELLADPVGDRRLAGIYALEALRRESPDLGSAVVDVLSTFVRREARWDPAFGQAKNASTEVQAALAVLGRRWKDKHAAERPLDLHGMALRYAYLPLVHFQNAFLYDCDLECALLVGAHLEGAWLGRTNLRNANLDGAHLEGADLSTARHLTDVQLRRIYVNAATRLPAAFLNTGLNIRPAFEDEEAW